ncbi:MAG TPA: hypothetical protein VKV04_19295 [Verrucomicrobiae bacterium]|nr:hypothetical protein [Verrucomicrobiae bacterium]
MKKILMLLCLGLAVPLMQAQETNEVEQLKQQLKQMQENFERVQREQKEQIDSLTKKLDDLSKQQQQQAATQTTSAPPAAVTADQFKDLSDKVDSVVESQTKELPGEFNPAIGLVGETIFSYNSKDSAATGSDRPGGFDVFQRSVELNIAASVDPFAKGYAVINGQADAATGEADLDVEEAALQTTSLPGNLELKAGRFFGEFGRLAYIHDHELPFVNRPLVLDQYIGGESQTDGAQLNWLVPMSHYLSVTAGVGDHFGDQQGSPNEFRTFTGLSFWGRVSTYFDLTSDWQLETGVSGLWNPDTEQNDTVVQPNGVTTFAERERRVAGLDVKLNYVPLVNNQFRGYTWGTEVLFSDNRYQVDPDGVPFNGDEFIQRQGAIGLYSYMTYKWSREWSGGFLFDYLQNAEDHNSVTFAYSPYVTWALSHWNQLRLQYTHTDNNAESGLKPNDAIYLQWAWIIGAHSHGWQQR